MDNERERMLAYLITPGPHMSYGWNMSERTLREHGCLPFVFPVVPAAA